MSSNGALEWVLRRDRFVVFGGLAGVIILAWAYIFLGAGLDTGSSGVMEMGTTSGGEAAASVMPMPWTAAYFALMFAMWAIMMVAMMLPSAAPLILLFATIDRRRHEGDGPYLKASLFTLGYVVTWSGFSVLATSLQWRLEEGMLLSPAMASSSNLLTGALLIAAGGYQFTPLKQVCLRHCRSPLDFLTQHWREGTLGAFVMGLQHGLFCLGCCWVLMGLLFVGGLAGILWVAAIALFVLLEKTVPAGGLLGRLTGLGFVALGGAAMAAMG
jgi:predicted metal-binding membrane protein